MAKAKKKTKKLAKKKDKKPLDKAKLEKHIDLLFKEYIMHHDHPTSLKNKYKKQLEDKKELSEMDMDELMKGGMMYGIDNLIALGNSVSIQYAPLVQQFALDVIKEFDCQTQTEKSMAHIIAQNYVRIMVLSRGLSSLTHIEYLSNEKNGYYGIMSKELDRAQRQYYTSITSLKMLKQPKIEVTVKSNKTFISPEQHIHQHGEKVIDA